MNKIQMVDNLIENEIILHNFPLTSSYQNISLFLKLKALHCHYVKWIRFNSILDHGNFLSVTHISKDLVKVHAYIENSSKPV